MLETDHKLNVGRMRKAKEVLYILSSFGESIMVDIGRYIMNKTRKGARLSGPRIAKTFPIKIGRAHV
jgi:hypothetical protein